MRVRSFLIAAGVVATFVGGYIVGQTFQTPSNPPASLPDRPAVEAMIDGYLTAHPAAIEARVSDYIDRHGEQVEQAVLKAHAGLDRLRREHGQEVVATRHAEIFDDPATVSLGDPKGDVTLVEFFDYRCPYCKADAPVIDKLLAGDPHLRIVLREMPILGRDSVYLAHLALAAGQQGRYHEFYTAVFAGLVGHAERKEVDQAVRAAGFEPETLYAASQTPEIEAAIKHDLDLAKAIGATGTPTWLVGNSIITLGPGDPPEKQLANYVELARKALVTPPPSAQGDTASQ